MRLFDLAHHGLDHVGHFVDQARLEQRLARLPLRRGAADLGVRVEGDHHPLVADRHGMHLVVERGTAEFLDRERVADHAAVDPLVHPDFPAAEEELGLQLPPVSRSETMRVVASSSARNRRKDWIKMRLSCPSIENIFRAVIESTAIRLYRCFVRSRCWENSCLIIFWTLCTVTSRARTWDDCRMSVTSSM